MLLVGCKMDLRQDQEVLQKLKDGRMEPISRQQVGVTSWWDGTRQGWPSARDSVTAGSRGGLILCVPAGRGHGPAGPRRVLHGMLGQVPG